jgi:tetratricopeptide (TPR) repeat protein
MGNPEVERRQTRGMKKTLAITLIILVLATLFIFLTVVKSHLSNERLSKASNYWDEAARLVNKGEWEKAIPWLDKAIQLDPRFSPAYSSRAFLYSEMGDKIVASGGGEAKADAYYKKALDDYKHHIALLSQSDKDTVEWHSIAIIYMKLKQYDEAKKYANLGLTVPNDKQAAQDLLKEIDARTKNSP